MDYMVVANSFWMWAACGLCVLLVLFQSALFVKKSLKAGKELGITDDQIRSAIRSSAIGSFGPSLVILAGMVSLIISMGGPVSWFRLSYIGAVAYELMAAGFAANAMGVQLGAGMPAEAFACGLWVMTLGSLGWVLFTAFCTHKLDNFRSVLAGGRKEMIPIVSVGAMAGGFAYMCLDRVIVFDKENNFMFTPAAVAALGGFVFMAAFTAYNKTAQKKWIREWSFCISMFLGMLVAVPFMN